jgi:hypothetical protein
MAQMGSSSVPDLTPGRWLLQPLETGTAEHDPFGKTVHSGRPPKENPMAVRIQQTRRRRRTTTELTDVTGVRMDESALIEAVEHMVDKIDEVTAG